ncbi:MAG TPA: ribonuclease inhibitor [Sphingomonas sp.]|nr:ribonuclease inhibitor [Sphingomonas sp.]
MTKTLEIFGRDVRDIPTFYAEINRVFMAGEDWLLANSLDALNDLLYGGYGAIRGREPAVIIWHDMAESRSTLGVEATRAFLTEKLQRRGVFNADLIARQLEALESGTGQTFFEIVIEIIGEHKNITLVAA